MFQRNVVKSKAASKKTFTVMMLAISVLLVNLMVVPARGAQQRPAAGSKLLTHLSQSVVFRYWLANPDQAPAQLQERFRQVNETISDGSVHSPALIPRVGNLFNLDFLGLPQNEESVTLCPSRPDIVLGGTNDYRGLLDPEGNFTGWHLSTDGGRSVANEGLLPPVEIAGNQVPSGGDPVVAAGGEPAESNCVLFAASLNYDPFDPFVNPNGIGLYRSDPDTLAACPGGSDSSCWPTRRAVAESEPDHFLDKEWFDVGTSGDAGEVVWVAYSDFVIDFSAPLGFTSASIKAVRCSADLSECTDPILISGDDPDVQFADVTIGPDGRTYITWSEIQGELEETAQTFIHKLRIAPAGSTDFGPERVVHVEDLAIPFGGFLHANDFRVATYPKNEVTMIEEQPRIFVVWDACLARPLDSVCEEPQIKLKYSDDDGANWSSVIILSRSGDNYFPAIAADEVERNETGRLAVAWYTNRFDPVFHNRQDVEIVSLDPSSVTAHNHRRLTRPSNETEADPLLGGFFIGDYIEVAVYQRKAYVHYNANYRSVPLLGQGFPIPQQDNFLVTVFLLD